MRCVEGMSRSSEGLLHQLELITGSGRHVVFFQRYFIFQGWWFLSVVK